MDLFAERYARMAVQRPRLSFMMGVLLTGLGLVFLVAATLRAGVLPSWCGYRAPSLAGWSSGLWGVIRSFVVVGLIWLALGHALGSAKAEVVGDSAYARERCSADRTEFPKSGRRGHRAARLVRTVDPTCQVHTQLHAATSGGEQDVHGT